MSREIHKKLDKRYFDAIKNGEKTFEYRTADFECEPGDILVLEEWEYDGDGSNIQAKKPTGRVIKKRVGYVAKINDFAWMSRPDVQADFEKYGAQIISLKETIEEE